MVGTVRLGMIGTTGRWLVPQLFDLLRVRHPHIHLNVAEGSSVQLEQQLASGQLDLAVVTFPLSGDEIMAAQLFDEDLVLVLPSGHPLAAEPSLPLERLSELELLLPAPGTALRAEIDSATGPARVALRPGDGARRRPADRLAGLRRLRAGHPPGHRRAGPPARPVLGAAGRPASPAAGSAWRSAAGACPRRPCAAVIDIAGRRRQRRALHARGHPPDLNRAGAPARRTQDDVAGCGSLHMVQRSGPSPGSGTSFTTSNP